MRRSLLLTLSIILFTFTYTSVSAETMKIFPTDDAVARLYDDDAISDWDEARNFQREIALEPSKKGSLASEGTIAVRSDKGVGTYRIYRVSKSFDFSQLPPDAVITKASLNLYKIPQDPVKDMDIVVTSHTRENINLMQKQDWKINNFGQSSFSRNNLGHGNFTEFVFNEEGLDYLNENVGGSASIGLLTEFDFDNVEPLGFNLSSIWYEIEKEREEFDPFLEIVYQTIEEPDKYPLYTQIESPYPSKQKTKDWADDTYASGTAACGDTIADCGCVITSLVMMARSEGIVEGVNETEVEPGNLNAWLKNNEGYTSFGSIKWAKAFDYFGRQEDPEGVIKTPFKLKNHNATSTSVIQAAATGTEHVIGFSDKVSGGHYFVVSDYIDGDYYVRDPWYYNTETMDDKAAEKVKDYDNDLDKANIISFQESEQLAGFLDIILASPAELRLEDEEGKMTGFAVDGNSEEIPTGSYDPLEFIGNPNEVSAGVPHYIKRLMVLEANGSYYLDVVGTGLGEYTLAISLRDTSGGSHEVEFIAPTEEGQIDRYLINMETGETSLAPVDLDQVLAVVDYEIDNNILNRFFKKWADKIFAEIEDEKIKQAVQHIETFQTLMKAKKVESVALQFVLDKLREQVEE